MKSEFCPVFHFSTGQKTGPAAIVIRCPVLKNGNPKPFGFHVKDGFATLIYSSCSILLRFSGERRQLPCGGGRCANLTNLTMLTELFFIAAVASTRYIEPLWQSLCQNVSEYTLFVGGCFLSQILGYFLGCLPFFLMDCLKLQSSTPFKIQKNNYATTRQVLTGTKQVLISFVTVILPMLLFGGFVIRDLGIKRDGPWPSGYTVAVQIVLFFIVEDYLNYWIHRWLHTPWLYRHVHSVHHIYDAPFSIVAAHAHPFEVIVLAIPTFMGPLLVAPHLYTLMLWQLFRNFEAIDIHSGYELPYSLKSIFPFYAGAKHHDYHHYMHSGNFASVFTWCDHLYGTDLGYQQYQAKQN